MAMVIVEGKVTNRREFPAKDDRGPQVSLSIEDGERFGVFVDDDPENEPLSLCDVGDYVEVRGNFRKSGNYLNIDDARLIRMGTMEWQTVES